MQNHLKDQMLACEVRIFDSDPLRSFARPHWQARVLAHFGRAQPLIGLTAPTTPNLHICTDAFCKLPGRGP